MKNGRRDALIEAIADYLTADMAKQSIMLSQGSPWAQTWARIFGLSGARGWCTREEAIEALRFTLLGEQAER